MTRADIERRLCTKLGAEKVVWLKVSTYCYGLLSFIDFPLPIKSLPLSHCHVIDTRPCHYTTLSRYYVTMPRH